MEGRAILCAFLLVIGYHSAICRTVYLNLNTPTIEELLFMKRYGYLDLPDEGDLDYTYTAHSISEAVARMQQFAGLPQTGTLDSQTRNLFSRKRCGVKDIESSSSSRSRRFVVSQGWNKKEITYRILNGSSTLAQGRIEELMGTALAVWAPHGGLTFRQLDYGQADIQVSFASEDHGDGFPFDGPGRVVAHAFPPPVGAMHFDDDELWGDNPDEEDDEVTDFFAVVVHEIGHALGLSHSSVKASVMYPYYQVPVERLHSDDILGLQKLYVQEQPPEGPSSAEVTEGPDARSSAVPRFTKAASEEDDLPDLCYTNYDTVQVIQGKLFVFEEEWVWVLREMKQMEAGYPRRFHDVFAGLPEHVTSVKAIYERQNGNVVIFSGRKYWEFDPTFRLTRRGSLSDYGIPSQVPELTTAFLSNYNNKTYLIEYERFWRFDERTHRMDRGYPKEMSAWRELPYPVDSAVIWKGDTYFFRGPRFWRFDNAEIRAHPYYPLPTAPIWFPCDVTPDMTRYITNDEP